MSLVEISAFRDGQVQEDNNLTLDSTLYNAWLDWLLEGAQRLPSEGFPVNTATDVRLVGFHQLWQHRAQKIQVYDNMRVFQISHTFGELVRYYQIDPTGKYFPVYLVLWSLFWKAQRGCVVQIYRHD